MTVRAGRGLRGVLAWARGEWRKVPRDEPGTGDPARIEAAADLLAERTEHIWADQAIVTPTPVRVRWTWVTPNLGTAADDLNRSPALPVDPEPLSDQSAEALGSGVVTRLHDEVYARLQHGRLVLTGGPGAGKTCAMLLILLAALERRRDATQEERPHIPVPVWLTLGSWNPEHQGLRDWVIESLQRDHPCLRAVDFGADAPARLFDTARIALFLDGLDDMPDESRPRAAQRLREESSGLRVVMTSRPDEYAAALAAGGPGPNTAVLEMRPVGVRAALTYLLADRTALDAERWTSLSTHLTTHPDGVLAQTLTTPLALSLARAAYRSPDTDPGQLLGPDFDTPAAVRAHLLDEVLTSAYPDRQERDHARYWLGWLAHQMNTDPDGPTRSLAWWRIPTYLPASDQRLARLLGGLVLGHADEPRSSNSRRLDGADVIAKFRDPVASGLVFGLLFGLVFGFAVGLVGGLAVGLAVGFLFGPGGQPRSLESRRLERSDAAVLAREPVAVGVVGGFMAARTRVGASQVARLSRAEGALWLTTGRPVRFMPLLEQALNRQVLCQAGALYQFRHAELQDRLADGFEREHLGGEPASERPGRPVSSSTDSREALDPPGPARHSGHPGAGRRRRRGR